MSKKKEIMNRVLITKEELKERRMILGLTPKQLGELCYLTKQTVLNIENGTSNNMATLYLMELVTDKLLSNGNYNVENCSVFKRFGDTVIRLEKRKENEL